MNICCIEFSNILTDEKRSQLDINNRTLLYTKRSSIYKCTEDFTEFPLWVNYVYGFFGDNNHSKTFHICRDVNDTIAFISINNFDYIFFSNILATKYYIETIVKNVTINTTKFIVGTGIGSSKLNLTGNNIFQYDSLVEFRNNHCINSPIKLSSVDDTIESKLVPRIYTSTGCNNNCKFCKNEGRFKKLNHEIISNYYRNNYNKELLYLGNKTFLQGGINEADDLTTYSNAKFIVQSCVNTLLTNLHLLYKYKDKIAAVELGIESFSETTLVRLGKNIDLHSLPYLVKYLNDLGIKVIFNLMLGIPNETLEDYKHTIEGIYKYKENIFALNIANYSNYDAKDETDKDERILVKSWHNSKNEVKEVTEFAELIYSLHRNILNK